LSVVHVRVAIPLAKMNDQKKKTKKNSEKTSLHKLLWWCPLLPMQSSY